MNSIIVAYKGPLTRRSSDLKITCILAVCETQIVRNINLSLRLMNIKYVLKLSLMIVFAHFSGKGENIWDHMFHTDPTVVKDGSNGDVAADSYHNYKRDVEMLRELGVDVYRFSISWSRILPTGMVNEINPAGIEFYNNYINEMLKYNIRPMATIYHFDLPQKLQELGGFQNPLISDWFVDYARVVFENFGDRVKMFITFNEPNEFCHLNYGGSLGTYLCTKNLLVAHARAYHMYNKEFKPTQKGQCGIAISVPGFDAATDSAEDQLAAELKRQGEVIEKHNFIHTFLFLMQAQLIMTSLTVGHLRASHLLVRRRFPKRVF